MNNAHTATMMTFEQLVWTPIVAALLWLAWSTFRYLLLLWWVYFVFRPAFIRLLDEHFPEEPPT